ncbi:MAG: glycosyl hydrolase family 18 protein, partial [bacterium]|nr:glycosyl hydrolase family 18 protein [bacterium]
TSFWGVFTPLSYPDNNLVLTTQNLGNGIYMNSLNLHFPSDSYSSSKLPIGKFIQLNYGTDTDDHIAGTANIYLATLVGTGSLSLKNVSNKPVGITQTDALIHLSTNGQKVNDIRVPWSGIKILSGLAAGSYIISAENINDTSGGSYQAIATPNTVAVQKDKTVMATIAYTLLKPTGQVKLSTNNLPPILTGYSKNPSVMLMQSPNGSSISQSLGWGSVVIMKNLKDGVSYNLSTSPISYNGYNCAPLFNPTTVIARANTPPLSSLTYQCAQVSQDAITININGAPISINSLKVTLTPNNNSAAIIQTVDLINGQGSSTVALTDGVLYSVTTDPVTDYIPSFTPQTFTATANFVENISLSKNLANGAGRIIGYIPGWKIPPPAQSLANAGYTHAIIAFGVFSTTSPGIIVPSFDTITKDYIQSLHQAGIKVILSLGGASSSLPNTSVDFHQVLSSASSPESFKQTFINSLNGLITQYGFDGFDIDIEQGLNEGGTFAQPQGDIAILANIINTMHSQKPTLLISLAPQVANISANSGFNKTWGNYASLIMQTHAALSWVGIQLYNTGCAFGIDQTCYGPEPTNNPDFTVAMATDLLTNWPLMVNGRATGFQPYISYLSPSQVVIGYPAPNASGGSDGSPVTPTTTIRRALQCLKTAVANNTSCGSYIPPKAYGSIGGVFNWEVTYDQNNGFKFATDLKNCIINSDCN